MTSVMAYTKVGPPTQLLSLKLCYRQCTEIKCAILSIPGLKSALQLVSFSPNGY